MGKSRAGKDVPEEYFLNGGRNVSLLRRLRERLIRKGDWRLALRVARVIARRAPGRESYFKLGLTLREAGRYREALRTLRDALRFRSGPRYVIPEIHAHLATAWNYLGNGKRMLAAIRRAWSSHPVRETQAKLFMLSGNLSFARCRYGQALEQFVGAEQSSPGPNKERIILNEALCLARLGRAPEARVELARAISNLRRERRQGDLVLARAYRAGIDFDQGRYGRALKQFVRVARDFRLAGNTRFQIVAVADAGYAAAELGLWHESLRHLDRAARLARAWGENVPQPMIYACRAWVRAHAGRWHEAQADLALAEGMNRRKQDWVATLHICRAHVRMAALVGNWHEVRHWASRAESVARRVGDLPRVKEFREFRARAEEGLGCERAARRARESGGRLDALKGQRLPLVRRIRRLLSKLGACRLPVLLVGEAGVGKTDLARELHNLGTRWSRPCVVVPCEQLSFPASDFAGHAAGAWTGAGREQPGYFKLAEGGTLVLDRVDELSQDGQQALDRMVDGAVRPVGQAVEERVDVRVIATCRTLDGLLPSLRHRLAGAAVEVPPLRDRRGEIPALVEALIAGRRRVSPDAAALLVGQRWEGNLIELRAVVERLVASSKGVIGSSHVRKALDRPARGSQAPAGVGVS